MDRPQRGRNRPAGCREGFEGSPKCLTSPLEAHKKRGGRLRTGHREAATGLPAAEKGLKAVQNAERQASDRPQRPQQAEKGLKAVQNA